MTYVTYTYTFFKRYIYDYDYDYNVRRHFDIVNFSFPFVINLWTLYLSDVNIPTSDSKVAHFMRNFVSNQTLTTFLFNYDYSYSAVAVAVANNRLDS